MFPADVRSEGAEPTPDDRLTEDKKNIEGGSRERPLAPSIKLVMEVKSHTSFELRFTKMEGKSQVHWTLIILKQVSYLRRIQTPLLSPGLRSLPAWNASISDQHHVILIALCPSLVEHLPVLK